MGRRWARVLRAMLPEKDKRVLRAMLPEKDKRVLRDMLPEKDLLQHHPCGARGQAAVPPSLCRHDIIINRKAVRRCVVQWLPGRPSVSWHGDMSQYWDRSGGGRCDS